MGNGWVGCGERVLVESSGMAAFDCSAATDESHGPAENRSSSSKHCFARGTHTRKGTHTQDIETETHLHGQWLVWERCDATDVRLVHAPVSVLKYDLE